MQQIVDKMVKAVYRVLNNEIPYETCPLKRQKAEWKKQRVLDAFKVWMNTSTNMIESQGSMSDCTEPKSKEP